MGTLLPLKDEVTGGGIPGLEPAPPSIISHLLSPPQVNGTNLREASHDEAINVLRQTPQRVQLVVYRDEAQFKEEDLWDSFTLELHRRPGQGLGLSIVGRRWETSGRPLWPPILGHRSVFSFNADLGITGNSADLGREQSVGI